MRCSLFCSLLLAGLVSAQDQTLSPEASAAALKRLEEIANQLGSAKSRKTAEAMKAFMEAVQSGDKAANLYFDCKKKVDFEDKGKAPTEWTDYKKSAEAKAYHDAPASTALRHQLSWLILTVNASNAANDKEAEAVILQIPSFLEGVLKDWDRMERHSRILRQNVLDSNYAQFYRLDQIIEKPENWELSPGNINSIYASTVLPYLKSKKNVAALQNAWSKRLEQARTILEIEAKEEKDEANDPINRFRNRNAGNAAERLLDFEKEGLPSLQWNMLRDLYQAGAQTQNAPLMEAHIRKHLGHRDTPDWIEDLEALLKGEELDTPAPMPSASPGRP